MFLEHHIAYEINRILDDLAHRDGPLVPLTRLAHFQANFRSRFGPDALAGLDGEALLRRMHGPESDVSLVHWLERKNDDDFNTSAFGALSGGSAFNHDMFFSRRRQSWVAGTPTSSREIGESEAIDWARRQHDELLIAADEVEGLPADADEGDYARLQSSLDQKARRVSNSAWGHKYLSVLFPEKLDPFHLPDHQRYHLIKLLVRPPANPNRGRYVPAESFVAIARALGGVPMPHLAEALMTRHGRRPHRYWRLGLREEDGGPSRWDLLLRDECAAFGLAGIGDLETVRRIRTGDVIAAMDGGDILGLGYARGSYYFADGEPYPHRVPVDWRSLEYWPLPYPEQLRSALGPLGRFDDNLLEIERHLLVDSAPFQTNVVEYSETAPRPSPSLIAEDKEPFYSAKAPDVELHAPVVPPALDGVAARIEQVLERKGQVILYGPPGTGKSYWAEVTARELAARSWYGRAWSQLTVEQAHTLFADGSAAVRTCCFHPAYGYEDFLEGYRPDQENTDHGHVRFERRDGIFKQLCQDAAMRPDRDFFLIIDEINRGDVPRIFGELLSVMEKSKRGKTVLLPLSGEAFAVPPNVYVIGTMNTADRSIALLDAALRRRFGFVEMQPDLTLLAGITIEGLPLAGWLSALNRRITDRLGRDGRHLEIGHAYFLDTDGDPVNDLATFARILRDDIVPLLEDHCYDDPSLLEGLLGSGLIDAKRNRVRYELFEAERRGELLCALLHAARDPEEQAE